MKHPVLRHALLPVTAIIFIILLAVSFKMIYDESQRTSTLAQKDKDYLMSIDSIHEQNSNHTDKLNQTIQDLEAARADLEQENNDLKETLTDTIEAYEAEALARIPKPDITELNDVSVELYTEGTRYLENGIEIIAEARNSSGDIIWKHLWSGIDVGELATHSAISGMNGRMYIVVSGTLYTMDTASGEILWQTDRVGSSDMAPLIENEDTLYTIGQYKPYLTALDSKGTVLWQINDDTCHGAYGLTMKNENLYLSTTDGEIIINKNGQLKN